MSNTHVVIATLVAYQLGLLAVGYWARSRASSRSGYLIGDYQLGPWVAALSYAAGSSSAWSILGVSGIAFSQGLSAFWLLPGTLTGHIVVWFVLAPRLQRKAKTAGWVTLTDVLVDGLPPVARRLTARIAAVAILFSFTFYVAAQFQGAANTFTAVFEFDFLSALLLGAAVVLVYTLWGGFWAVSVTDALQAGLMLLASIVLPLVGLYAVGGFSGLVPQEASGAFWSWQGGHSGWFGVGFFLGMLSIGFGPLGQPHLLNRIMALRSAQDIARARLIALVWFTVVLGGMFLLGLIGNKMLGAVAANEQVFFVLVDELLPPVLTGVLIAAVLSAIMSTADSQLLVAGGTVQNDLGMHARAENDPRVARLAVLAVALAAVALAVLLPESIFSRVLFAWNALGAAFGPLLIARLWGWSMCNWAIPSAVLTGFGLTVCFYLLPDGPGDLWERAIPFLSGALLLVIGGLPRARQRTD